MTKKLIPSSLKVVGKHAVDAIFVVPTLNEARENAYPGYQCYVEEENKHYKFKYNDQRNLTPYPDETINTDFFAAKTEVDKKADKTFVDTELSKKSNTSHAHSNYADINHLHDTLYAKKSDITDFATRSELSGKADINHRHDGDYASKTHGHSGYAAADHLHDERYPTRAELLNGAGIQQYIHPLTHPASMIETSPSARFTSDAEMATKVEKMEGKSLVLDTEILRLIRLKEIEASSQNGYIQLNGVETPVYQHPAGTNPHGTTAADVGLGNVSNESKETMFSNPVFTGDVTIPDPLNPQNPTSKIFVETELGKKLDKEEGKSLVLDTEIIRLSKLKEIEASSQNGNILLNGVDTPIYQHPAGTNPHGTNAADIGLGNVSNESKESMFSNPVFTGDITIPDPVNPQNPTSKIFVETYVDKRITGLDQKSACRAATTVNISLTGLQTIDGVNVGIGDRVLVKNQTDATKNGIYNVAAGAWMRAADFDNIPNEELRAGTYVFINEGTKNNNSGWRLTTYGTIVIGYSELLFAQFNGLAQTTAGVGLLKDGNEYSLDLARIATQSANGLLSASDKTKLDGIAAGANNYVHPATHLPSVIAQDANNRFVSDTEKATWNAKASTTVATQAANGLMAASDKAKLDGIAAGANNYSHPDTHSPSVIAQDANNRFVSDSEKAIWNAKASTAIATQASNGLMAATDKTKLDGIATGADVNVQSDFSVTDSASDAYIKNAFFSKKTRDNCRVTTTTNVSVTAAPSTIDGVALAVGNRILVKNQTTKTQNGIYIVSTVGTGANGVWVRAADADSWAKIYGCLVAVEEGVTQADTGYFCKADILGTLGTTDINFLQIFGTGTYNGGVGIAFNNGSFSFSPADNNMLTGYAKALASAAIAPTDSLNVALGKLEYKFDNILLGVRNLITGTSSTDKSITVVSGNNYYTIIAEKLLSSIGLKGGDTISVAAIISDIPAGFTARIGFRHSNGTTATYSAGTLIAVGNQARCTTILPADCTLISVIIWLSASVTANTVIKYNSLKLEKGNILTDYSPAFEDFYAENLALANYAKAAVSAPIAPSDSVNAALGKLERTFDDKLDKSKTLLGSSVYQEQFLGSVSWAENIANQKVTVELSFTAMFYGVIYLKVLQGYSYANNTGLLVKKISCVLNPTSGVISSQESKYIEKTYLIASGIAVSDIFWNAATGKFNVTIFCRNSRSNQARVIVQIYDQYSLYNNARVPVENWSLSAIYTTDTSAAPTPKIDLHSDTTIENCFIANYQQTVSFSSSIAFDYSLGNCFNLTLTGNTTITMSNIPDGGRGVITLTQDTTGSRLLTSISHTGLTVKYKNGDSALTTTANKTDILRYERIGSVLYVTLDKNF